MTTWPDVGMAAVIFIGLALVVLAASWKGGGRQ